MEQKAFDEANRGREYHQIAAFIYYLLKKHTFLQFLAKVLPKRPPYSNLKN